jgi:hypothetical protein
LPWNGSGVFNRVYSWVADAAASLLISSSRMDTDSNDIVANGLGNVLTRDGQGFATANLPMGGFRHTGAGAGVSATDYAQLQQAGGGTVNWVIAAGTAEAQTAAYSPAIALQDGQIFYFRAFGTNVTTAPTFAPNGNTARAITRHGGKAIQPGDLVAGGESVVRYNLANTRYELLNPQTGNVAPARVANDFPVTSSAVLINVTGLSVNVAAGLTYYFEAYLTCTDAAAGGVKAAIAGTATATTIIYDGWLTDSNTILGQTNATSLATAVASSITTATSGLVITIKGTISVNAAGTLTVQFAQNTSNGTPSTVKAGSTFTVRDVP